MSLTSLLRRNADIRIKLREYFPKPRTPVINNPIASPKTKHYSLVGAAFDYLFRWIIERANNKVYLQEWIAEKSINTLYKNNAFKRKCVKLFNKAKENYNIYKKTGTIDEATISAAIYLAQIDLVYRAHYHDPKLGKTYKNDIKDLMKLVELIPTELFIASKQCILNPSFNLASMLARGADADIIIDDTIIDVKTTKICDFKGQVFQQLIGYYLLNHIDGINGLDFTLEIKNALFQLV